MRAVSRPTSVLAASAIVFHNLPDKAIAAVSQEDGGRKEAGHPDEGRKDRELLKGEAAGGRLMLKLSVRPLVTQLWLVFERASFLLGARVPLTMRYF